MENTVATRYKFTAVFSYDILSRIIIPLYNVQINGKTYYKDMTLQAEAELGKLSPYSNLDKDVAGVWNNGTQVLEIVGYY